MLANSKVLIYIHLMRVLHGFIRVYILITLIIVPLSVQANYTCAHSGHGAYCIHCDDDHKSSEYALSFNLSDDPYSCCHIEIKLYSEFVDVLPLEETSGLDPPSSALVINDGRINYLTSPQILLPKSHLTQRTSYSGTSTYFATRRIRI